MCWTENIVDQAEMDGIQNREKLRWSRMKNWEKLNRMQNGGVGIRLREKGAGEYCSTGI